MIRLAANHREGINQSQGVWDYISPSRLNLWLKCPLAWKLRYVDGVKTPPTPALFLGTRVHDALEMTFLLRVPVPPSNRRGGRRSGDPFADQDQGAEDRVPPLRTAE